MKRTPAYLLIMAAVSSFGIAAVYPSNSEEENEDILTYVVDPSEGSLRMFYTDAAGEQFNSFRNLKTAVEGEGKDLLFAMNGGMYMEDRRPLGLYIEAGEEIRKLNTRETGHGNFYLQPNGVFLIHVDGMAEVCPRDEFEQDGTVQYATQSGPMLLIDGNIHSSLSKGSENVHIRNGVGILPDGQVLFAMSRGLINFWDFADFFRSQGCLNALYLDGFVSRTYLPEQDVDYLGGNFGVIIAHVN